MAKSRRNQKRYPQGQEVRRQPQSQRQKPQPKKAAKSARKSMDRRRRPPRNYKAPTLITFFLLTVYLLGYLFAFTQKPSIGVETVGYGTIDTPKVFSGIIIREETVFKSAMEGQAVYQYSEGERVKKGALVCSIKNIENTNIIEPKIEGIDKNIIKQQKSRSDISIFQDEIDNIEQNISSVVDSYTYRFIGQDISEMYVLKGQVDTQIKRRNDIWIMENTKGLSELSQEKLQYESQLAENVAEIATDQSGILSLHIDGLEETLTPDARSSITEEQTKMKVTPEMINRSVTMKPEDPVFKIITSNVWYIATYIPVETASAWAAGETKQLHTTLNEEERILSATIEEIQTGTKNSLVLFRTDKEMVDFMNVRSLEFKIVDTIYNGIKIPNTAIVEKTLLQIPAECLVESVGEQGVLKKEDGAQKFVKVRISHQDTPDTDPETKEYAYILQDFAMLKLGDVIYQGAGENAAEYTVTDVVTDKGVYVANTSIAEFVTVNIIAENNEYSIVEASEGNYGLKVYDNIVSDAKSIQESDTIY